MSYYIGTSPTDVIDSFIKRYFYGVRRNEDGELFLMKSDQLAGGTENIVVVNNICMHIHMSVVHAWILLRNTLTNWYMHFFALFCSSLMNEMRNVYRELGYGTKVERDFSTQFAGQNTEKGIVSSCTSERYRSLVV